MIQKANETYKRFSLPDFGMQIFMRVVYYTTFRGGYFLVTRPSVKISKEFFKEEFVTYNILGRV